MGVVRRVVRGAGVSLQLSYQPLVCSGWNSSTKWRRFFRFAKVLEENFEENR